MVRGRERAVLDPFLFLHKCWSRSSSQYVLSLSQSVVIIFSLAWLLET